MNDNQPVPPDGQTGPDAETARTRNLERLLIEASHVLNADLDLDRLLENILRILTRYLDAEASAIYLQSAGKERAGTLTFTVDGDVVANISCAPPTEGVAAGVMSLDRTVLLNNMAAEPELKSFIEQRLGIVVRNLLAVPIIHKDRLWGVIQVINKKDNRQFTQEDQETMEALSQQITMAVSNADLILNLRRKSIELQSLYEVGKLLSAKLDLEELLELIVEQVTHLVHANLATIYLVDPDDGSIKEVVSMGIPPEYQARLTMKIGEGITGWVAKTGQAALINDVSTDSHYVPLLPETKSEIAVPLLARGKVIGVFNVESDRINAYTQEDLNLLEMFASQAAVSLERARLHRQAIQQKALQDELDIARRIQKTFLPAASPQVPGYDIAGVNIPSEAVGGDYFDFIKIVENQLGLAIGDVSGKGIGAALIMATFRASLRAEIRNNFAIRTIFSKVNSLLYESLERQNYVTAAYGVLDVKNRIFTFSNAGHPPPLLLRSSGEIIELSQGGYALGMFPDSTYEEGSVYLGSGDVMLFYTDGVTEAVLQDSGEFGQAGLRECLLKLKHLPANEILQGIVTEIKTRRAAQADLDDLTMILVKAM